MYVCADLFLPFKEYRDGKTTELKEISYPLVKDLYQESREFKYRLVNAQHFPHKEDNRSFDEKVLDEVTPYLRELASQEAEWLDGNPVRINLIDFDEFSGVRNLGVDVQQIR